MRKTNAPPHLTAALLKDCLDSQPRCRATAWARSLCICPVQFCSPFVEPCTELCSTVDSRCYPLQCCMQSYANKATHSIRLEFPWPVSLCCDAHTSLLPHAVTHPFNGLLIAGIAQSLAKESNSQGIQWASTGTLTSQGARPVVPAAT